jgi:hypothetical protein
VIEARKTSLERDRAEEGCGKRVIPIVRRCRTL